MIQNNTHEKKTSLSFEVFPPKKDEEFENVYQILRDLAKLNPDFISCTYGAGGSRAGKTAVRPARIPLRHRPRTAFKSKHRTVHIRRMLPGETF